MDFHVTRNASGWDLFDDARGACLIDTAPSLDFLRGYVRGLSDGESMCGPEYSLEELVAMDDAINAAEEPWSARTVAS